MPPGSEDLGKCLRLLGEVARGETTLHEPLYLPAADFTGPARRVVLDQLEARYRRPFADQWAFVRFAHEQNLGLDFISPPKRSAVLADEKK